MPALFTWPVFHISENVLFSIVIFSVFAVGEKIWHDGLAATIILIINESADYYYYYYCYYYYNIIVLSKNKRKRKMLITISQRQE